MEGQIQLHGSQDQRYALEVIGPNILLDSETLENYPLGFIRMKHIYFW